MDEAGLCGGTVKVLLQTQRKHSVSHIRISPSRAVGSFGSGTCRREYVTSGYVPLEPSKVFGFSPLSLSLVPYVPLTE